MAEEKEIEKSVTTEKVISEAEELPKAIVRRVVKDKLSQLSTDSDISLLRDSLQAFSESARIFIHYLSATANDVCKESNRQIINAEDVFKALEEIEFSEFIGPLRASLQEFRQKNAEKKSGSSKAKDTNNTDKKSGSSKAKETNNAEKKSGSSKAKDTNNTEKKSGSSKAKETENAEKKSGSSKAKETNKKLKRKEPHEQNEGKKKRREDESNEDVDESE